MATPIFPPGVSPDVLTPIGGGPPISYTDSVNAVDKAFSDVFNRAPSGQDLNDWVAKGYAYVDNANGVAQFEQVIRTSLAGSAEAWNDINGTFWSILNRGDDAGGIASAEGLLASGAVTLQGWRVTVADSPEAQNDIIGIVQQVLNRQPLGADITYGQMQFIGGANQAILRADWAYGAEAQNDIDGFYARELDRAPTASELSAEQASLASGTGTQGQLRSNLAWGTEAGGKIWSIYQSVLGRPATQTEIQAWQTGMANGSQTLAGVQSYEAYTGEAQGRLDWLYTVVLGRSVDSQGLTYFEGELASGTSEAQVRVQLAQTTEAAGKLGGLFWQVLNRAASAADLSYWEGALGGSVMLSDIGPALSVSAEATDDVNGLYEQVLNRAAQTSDTQWAESELAAGWTQATVRTNLAYSGEANTDINWLYQVTLGRATDPTGLAAQIAALSSGQNQAQIRVSLAQSAEEAGDVSALFSALLGRAPSADETAGVQAAVGASYAGTEMFTLAGVVDGAAQTFATADAATNLSELATYVTLNSGVTPTLVDPYGGSRTFANATQLAGFLLGEAIEGGTANPVLLSTYNLTVGWLAQTDQPELQAGEAELNAARAAQAGGNAALAQADEVTAQVQFDTAALAAAGTGASALAQAAGWAQAAQNAVSANIPVYATFDETAARVFLALATTSAPDAGQTSLLTAAQQFVTRGQTGVAAGNENLVNLCNAGADLCLQEVAEPAGARAIGVERIYQSGNVTLDVAVDPNSTDPYGLATFHSKDQDGGITGFLEPLLTAVLDVTAVVTDNEWLIAVASVVNAGEAAQNFAEGNVLAGVLDLGAATGFGAQAVSAFAAGAGGLSGASNAAVINAAAGDPTVLGGTVGGTQIVGQYVLEATALVGGLSGIVNSAENSDGVGVVAASLEAAAAVASGLATADSVPGDAASGGYAAGADPGDAAILNNVATALGIAGGVTAGVSAIENGHVADGLLTTLGPLFGAIAANYQSIAGFVSGETDSVADYQGPQQYASVSPAPVSDPSVANSNDPLTGGTVTFVSNGATVSGTVIGVFEDSGNLSVSIGPGEGATLRPSSVVSYTPAGGQTATAVVAATVGGVANEVAVLNASARALRLVSIPAATIPGAGEVAVPLLQVSAALLNLYALHLSLQTVTTGTVAGTNIAYTLDTKTDILALGHLNPDGSQVGDFVQLAIGADGSLTDADGTLAGQMNPGGGFTINPVFQAEYAAGNVGYVGDTSTVYQLSELRKALGTPPSGIVDPEANHIVPGGGPQNGGRDPTPAQKTLKACGVSLDSEPNGVFLSRAFHARIHTTAYYNWVNSMLSGASTKTACVSVLNDIASILTQDDAIFTQSGGKVLPIFGP